MALWLWWCMVSMVGHRPVRYWLLSLIITPCKCDGTLNLRPNWSRCVGRGVLSFFLFNSICITQSLLIGTLGQSAKKGNMMNKYKCFFKGRTADISADTSYEAHRKAVESFKASKYQRHLISVVLCKKGDKQVTHSTGSIWCGGNNIRINLLTRWSGGYTKQHVLLSASKGAKGSICAVVWRSARTHIIMVLISGTQRGRLVLKTNRVIVRYVRKSKLGACNGNVCVM